MKVHAGVDPISGKRHYLTEVIPAGSTAKEAEKARTRLLAQMDERRNPRTHATLDQLLDRWLKVADIEATSRMGYVNKLNKHHHRCPPTPSLSYETSFRVSGTAWFAATCPTRRKASQC
ncbi:hypothetical protein AB0B27_25440 [Micromonospora rifamycinica]|uniref:hypothetical protein n=1 Tax=Micromonospora rifamycinica TaxID=291594 RepID=UPI0033EE9B85